MADCFSPEQLAFLRRSYAPLPHTHTADEITDFDESVTEILDTPEEDDDDHDG